MASMVPLCSSAFRSILVSSSSQTHFVLWMRVSGVQEYLIDFYLLQGGVGLHSSVVAHVPCVQDDLGVRCSPLGSWTSIRDSNPRPAALNAPDCFPLTLTLHSILEQQGVRDFGTEPSRSPCASDAARDPCHSTSLFLFFSLFLGSNLEQEQYSAGTVVGIEERDVCQRDGDRRVDVHAPNSGQKTNMSVPMGEGRGDLW